MSYFAPIVMRVSGAVGSTAAGAILKIPNIDWDSAGGYNATTGQYTAPVTGYYNCFMGGQQGGGSVSFGIYINGTLDKIFGVLDAVIGTSGCAILISVTAGQTIDVRPVNVSTTLLSGNWFSIQMVK